MGDAASPVRATKPIDSIPQDAPSTAAASLLDLPYELFIEVLGYLSPASTLALRRLNRQSHAVLTRSDLCVSLIKQHFPLSLEARRINTPSSSSVNVDWAKVFATLARRYWHLGTAAPWRAMDIETDTSGCVAVHPWNRHLMLDERTSALQHPDPFWTFDAESGLLVYPAPDGLGLQLRDLHTNEQVEVPFSRTGRVLRRLRLKDGVVIVEWCEEDAFHALNERTSAHRHFATAFDVARTAQWDGILPVKDAPPSLSLWRVTFRSEWKIHYLGLPLTDHDRFFSAHNSTHYVVYIWQPNRSPYAEDDPLERLVMWDISSPSPYRPSLDPGNREKPETGGPTVVHRLVNSDLSVWGVRQSQTPRLRSLEIDNVTRDPYTGATTGSVFFHEEDHRWCTGPHASPIPPRLHSVRVTGIPLAGIGPKWLAECGVENGEGLTFCRRGLSTQQDTSRDMMHDEWPGYSACWRHDDFPYLTVAEVFDRKAGVRITARHCFMLETLSVHVRPKLRLNGVTSEGSGCDPDGEGITQDEVQFPDEWWDRLLGKGYIAGDERCVVGENAQGNITAIIF
ncbi:uncharacterized protein F5Z01DRAFT_160791 [Emericellopsis atlantica]|uniref:F-box domain-containing protein n=1 Tax=Emericellopsis atlantica TaxID=2614577 RepID=A0A9P8CNP0_9HYPO|nr:uncharacterized protein F5Z01DRAFT_160791 [Emericellopsis atlantica]KAG9253275.1 hypothetical protein F5Z01DRAFT_160791 [Emericellopsis atlantica]